jgi:hypothetical protein
MIGMDDVELAQAAMANAALWVGGAASIAGLAIMAKKAIGEVRRRLEKRKLQREQAREHKAILAECEEYGMSKNARMVRNLFRGGIR